MAGVTIPLDIYDAPTETIVLLTLGGVRKNSVKLLLEGMRLRLTATRDKHRIKESLTPLQEQCFWGTFEKDIALPTNAAVDRIRSELSPENILTIIIPKIVNPEEILVDIL